MRAPVLLLVLAQAAPVAAPFAVAPVSDEQLSTMRGGFRLPSGIDVALTVQTQTAVDGNIVLRTIFRADQGAPTMAAYVPRAGTTVPAGQAGAGEGGMVTGAPTVTLDNRSIRVTPGFAVPGISVGTATGDPSAMQGLPEGLEEAGAAISAADRGGLRTVALGLTDLEVVHFAGNAFGSAITNAGNDRVIDTQTTVAIDLNQAGPDVLGSAMLRASDLTFTPLQMRGR